MESKTKYRILGILVIAAIVVIVMPFLHFKKDSNRDIASAPPFPEQNSQVTGIAPMQASNEPIDEQPADTINNNGSATIVDNASGAVVSSTVIQPSAPAGNDQATNNATISVANNNQANVKSNTNTDNNETTQALQTALASSMQQEKLHDTQHAASAKKHQIKTHVVKANTKKTNVAAKDQRNIKLNSQAGAVSIHDNGLYDVKTPVWVIQLGSFQSKSSAVRMVNSLRANGYKAFFQEIDTVLGEKTRVFVGPELNQVAARHLAKQLETELKVRGVVASYKPFAL